jgi:lysophospholipase L1-like esterase
LKKFAAQQSHSPCFRTTCGNTLILLALHFVNSRMKRVLFTCGSLILIAFVFINCTKQTMPAATNLTPPTTQPSHTLRYLALGDSYTIGQNVAATDRFPYLTAMLLRTQGKAITEPEYIATTGWTTANLLAAINNAQNLGTFDIVSLLIGVNDQYQHLDTAGYRTRFSQLLDKAVALAANRKNHVFVLSIPDYSATPFVDEPYKEQVRTAIDGFNAINKEITLLNGISYIDITPLTRQAATDTSLLANDELHYSGKAHQQWAELLAPAIKKDLP